MINLDGSSGGGQMLRHALALSALTGIAFRMVNIRAKRQNPGLKPQHVCCVDSAAMLCNGYSEGVSEGSSSIVFIPRKLKARNITIDIGTAGSIPLLIQSILIGMPITKMAHIISLFSPERYLRLN